MDVGVDVRATEASMYDMKTAKQVLAAKNQMIASGWTLVCGTLSPIPGKGGFSMIHEGKGSRFLLNGDTLANVAGLL